MASFDINNNIIANRWKERYEKLSDGKKNKLEVLSKAEISEYQLQVIKRKRIYPKKGDIFEIKPKGNILLHGMVINNHINNINGDDLLLVLIFKEHVDVRRCVIKGIKSDDLLIPPQIVGKEYWARGYFCNVDGYDDTIRIDNYGFYYIGKHKFCDEYGNEMKEEPELLGIYGVATIIGVAKKINQELIIAGIL